jgi:hypothetical protein
MTLLKLNRPQLQVVSRFPRLSGGRFIWGRGVGKSSIIAWIMMMINRFMPRSAWGLQGVSLQQILTLTLPGTLKFFELMGLRENRDFFLGKYPPKDFQLPYFCPRNPEKCLFLVNHNTRTSVVFVFLSQDTKSPIRGASLDGLLVDEALLLNIQKFMKEAKATNRGNRDKFKHIPYHHAIFYFSSMPQMGSWLLETSDHYLEKNPELFKTIDYRIELQLEFLKEKSRQHKLDIWKEISELSRQIKFYPDPDGVLHSEYNVFDNIENLGLRYIEDMFQGTPPDIFEVEVLNKRQYSITNSFYPQLNRLKHAYYGHFDYGYLSDIGYNFERLSVQDSRQDQDCNPNEPLCVGMDFGTSINWIVAGQDNPNRKQFTFLKNFFVKPPYTFLDCAENFCKYYVHHKNKSIFLYPDGEGNIRRANLPDQPTYVDQIRKVFAKHGWTVFLEKTDKYNQENHNTFLLWDSMLSEQQTGRLPTIRFNAIHCKELLLSMERTPAINIGPRIKKDKTSERKLISNREEATDAGDAADQIIFTRFKYLLKERVPMGTPGSL